MPESPATTPVECEFNYLSLGEIFDRNGVTLVAPPFYGTPESMP